MKKIIFKDLIKTPWKNGQGTTRQIAIFPKHSNTTDFIWRISAATINTPGQFSLFNNITRSLALLTGEKISLNINNQIIDLYKGGQPITFKGDVPTALIDCPEVALDFSIMTNDTYAKHSLVYANFNGDEHYQRKAAVTFLLALKPCQIHNTVLSTFDSLLLSNHDPQNLQISQATALLIAEISIL